MNERTHGIAPDARRDRPGHGQHPAGAARRRRRQPRARPVARLPASSPCWRSSGSSAAIFIGGRLATRWGAAGPWPSSSWASSSSSTATSRASRRSRRTIVRQVRARPARRVAARRPRLGGALLVRNMVRLIDSFVGVWLMLLDPRARRLGDRLAGTLVVHERARADREIAGRRASRRAGARARSRVVESLLRRAEAAWTRPARQRLARGTPVLRRARRRGAARGDVPVRPPPLERLRHAVGAA